MLLVLYAAAATIAEFSDALGLHVLPPKWMELLRLFRVTRPNDVDHFLALVQIPTVPHPSLTHSIK